MRSTLITPLVAVIAAFAGAPTLVAGHAIGRYSAELDGGSGGGQQYFGAPPTKEVAGEEAEERSDSVLLRRFLDSLENDILPLTARGIEHGGGVYGAGIYSKANLSLLATGTNMWNKSPLIHGETDCIGKFFELPESERPRTKETYFFTTHEPCPMCLSAITWSGFNNIFIFFPYSYSESHFDEPYSRLMTEAIWKIRAEGESEEEWKRRELYARKNRFWEARYVEEMVSGLEEGEEKRKFVRRVEGIKREYGKLWKRYEEIPRPPGSGRPDE